MGGVNLWAGSVALPGVPVGQLGGCVWEGVVLVVAASVCVRSAGRCAAVTREREELPHKPYGLVFTIGFFLDL